MMPTASMKLTEGDVIIVEINFPCGSHTANANTEIVTVTASTIYIGFENTFFKTF